MGLKNLGNVDDVKRTKSATEQAPSFFLSIPEQRTPWRFLSLDYADGFVHWVDVSGMSRRFVCAGGLEGKGFAPEECPVCAHVLAMYQEAKRLNEMGSTDKGGKLKDAANRMRGKAEVQFKAIRGQRVLVKTRTGKEWIADWDTEDEDSSVSAGIISMSDAQFSGLISMINGDSTPFITVGDDLGKRVLWTSKVKRKGSSGGKYSAVVWDADEAESDAPDIEIPEELENFSLEDNFAIDLEALDKVMSLITGRESEEVEDDEEVDLDDDSPESDEPGEDFLSDVEDDDEDYDDEDDEDDEDDDDESEIHPEPFDDDDFEEVEPEVKPKPVKRKTPVKPAPTRTVKKPVPTRTVKKPEPTKRSGKARL